MLEVEPHRLELIALVGRVHITADALQLCLDQGIVVAWLRAIGELKAMGGAVSEATSREVLLGVEDDAARRYFAGLRIFFRTWEAAGQSPPFGSMSSQGRRPNQ